MKGNEFEYLVNNLSLSTKLTKFSFAFLLLSMLFYWSQASFKYTKETFLGKAPSLAMWLANIALALTLSIRWIESGHFPLSNLYESLLFLSWSLTTIHFFLERAFVYTKGISIGDYNATRSKLMLQSNTKERTSPSGQVFNTSDIVSAPMRKKGQESEALKAQRSVTLGAITAPLALFTNAFATFSLPQEMQKVTVLVPALQSNWLIMHVSVMMVSYAALLSGSLLAMAFLVVKLVEDTFSYMQKSYSKAILNIACTSGIQSNKLISQKQVERVERSELQSTSSQIPYAGLSTGLIQQNEQILENKLKQTLDNLSYRSIGLGFALLTIGIFSGAVWANEAWGSYWSWDPKETWAFITWLLFALYLHTRLSRGWVGKESALVATFGFLVIWFCYLGVNLFGKGLHSYGWFPVSVIRFPISF